MDHGYVKRFLERHTELDLKPEGARGEWRGSCPFHTGGTGGKNFAINTHTGFWICRAANSGCGKRGGFPLFYKTVEGLTWDEVRKRLKIESPTVDWDEFLSFTKQVREATFQDLPPTYFQKPVSARYFPSYLRTRGYDESVCDLGFDIRAAFAGDYMGRLLLPYYDLDRKLLTFSARSVSDNTSRRYVFPANATPSLFLYGLHRLAAVTDLRRLWVVEGPFDAIRLASLGEHAVALSTNRASPRQLLDLVCLSEAYDCAIVTCLDRGAEGRAVELWSDLKGLGVNAVDATVALSTFGGRIGGGNAKDPGELDRVTLDLVLERVGKKLEVEDAA